MSYIFKRRESETLPESWYLDVFDAEAGDLLRSFALPDCPLSGGYSISSTCYLSPQDQFLEIVAGQHFMGDHEYKPIVYYLTTGQIFYDAQDEDRISYSLDGRYVYVKRDAWHSSGETLVLDAASGQFLETRYDQGALYAGGAGGTYLKFPDEV